MLQALAAAGMMAGQSALSAWNSSNNIGMQRETNALNYNIWQKQLDYDRPVNQVERLKEAGLNPALMYGTGSGANLAPKPTSMEAPKGDYRLDPSAAVAVQQARLLGEQRSLVSEQARGQKLENDTIAGSPGSTRHDSAITRGLRDYWNTAKETGGDFIEGMKRSKVFENGTPSKVMFGDWGAKRQGLFAGPKPQGYTHPLMRGRKD